MASKIKKFTLIEFLVVVAIIAIIASMLLPALNKARDKAKGIACKNQLKQVGYAVMFYAEENDGWVLQMSEYVAWWKPLNLEGGINKKKTYKKASCPASLSPNSYETYGTYMNTIPSGIVSKIKTGTPPRNTYFQRLGGFIKNPSKYFFIGDTADEQARQRSTFYIYNAGLTFAYFALRHSGRANIWFADGHVADPDKNTLKPDYNIRVVRTSTGQQITL